MKTVTRQVLFVVAGLLGTGCGSKPHAPPRDGAAADASTSDDAPTRDGSVDAKDAKGDAQTVDASADTPASDADARPNADATTEAPPADAGHEAGDAAWPQTPGTPYRALAIAVGRYHTCAILDDHGVKCWGFDNFYGQMGLGDNKKHGVTAAEMGDALPKVDLGTGRTAKAIAAARYATCVILDDDTIKCWGYGGQTGIPSETLAQGMRGDEPGEMGDALPRVDLGGRKARRLAMGYYSACAELDDGAVRCWDNSTDLADVPSPRFGQHTIVALAGTSGVMALFDDGQVAAFRPGGGGPTVYVAPPTRLAAIGGSRTRSCGAREGGGVICDAASSPPFSATSAFVAVAPGEVERVSGLRADGRVVCFDVTAAPWSRGEMADGALVVALGQPAVALSGGADNHACALLADGGVKCWQYNTTVDTPALLGASVPNGNYLEDWREIDLGTHGPH
jgi:hypothetical protein